MSIKKITFLILYCELQLVWSQATIPEALKECYRNNGTFNPQLPLNLRIIVDIIQKMEKHSYTSMNMRRISSAILHRFKFDGVEYQKDVQASEDVLPFSATGTQSVKHKLILELIPGNTVTLPVHVLSQTERCILHQAISNTVFKLGNGKSNKTCSEMIHVEKLTGTSHTNSWNCPMQQGVVLTSFGTVATGSIIGAVAASLQRQNVAVNQLINLKMSLPEANSTHDTLKYDEEEVDFVLPKSEMSREPFMWYEALMTSSMKVDNVWLTTIAGELAEMVVYQGPLVGYNMTLGATGFWENVMHPTIYYLTSPHQSFDATRAELIGGIDGMIIANNLQTWIQDFYSLRLSQILEMYYSQEGIAFNRNVRACDRVQAFFYSVPKTILNEQTYAIAQMLAYRKSIAYISPETLQKLVDHVTEQFYAYAEKHLFPQLPCQDSKEPRVEALIVFDGAWSVNYTKDFLSVLIQELDVSMYGSKIGIVHGTSGEWLLNVTNSPSSAFEALNNLANVSWPTRLDFVKCLNTVSAYLNNTWENNRNRHVIGNLGQVVIFLTPLHYMSGDDKKSAMTILRQIKYNHPDVHFVYYISRYNADLFKSLILSDEDYLINNSNIDAIIKYTITIPKVLRPMPVNDSNNFTTQCEDYITPSKSITYKLHSNWRQTMSKLFITIHAFGYGTMKACLRTKFKSNDNNGELKCTELSGYKEINFTDPLGCANNCPDTYLQIQNVTSLYKCAEIDCKRPDQVRFIIRMNPQSPHGNSANRDVLVLFNFVIVFVLLVLR